MNQRRLLKDNSNKLFTKIDLANTLTSKEIDKLNARYIDLGLYIKQAIVDDYGSEISTTDTAQNLLKGKTKRQKRHTAMTLKDFFCKYYCGSFASISKKKKHIVGPKNKKRKISDDSNQICSIEDLKKLSGSLKDAYENCQQIRYKECKIENTDYKEKVIKYIFHYKNYISEEQYMQLFNKWRNEQSKTKDVDPSKFSELNDLRNWKISILKAFKSEILIKATINIYEKKIIDKNNKNNNKNDNISKFNEEGISNNDNENGNDNENDTDKNNKSDKEEERSDGSESSEEDYDVSFNDLAGRLNLERQANEDDSENNFNK